MEIKVNLENLLQRRKVSIERFLDGEGIVSLKQLDAWKAVNPSYEITDGFLEMLEDSIRGLSTSPTLPTPSTSSTSLEKHQEVNKLANGSDAELEQDKIISIQPFVLGQSQEPANEQEHEEEKPSKPKTKKHNKEDKD